MTRPERVPGTLKVDHFQVLLEQHKKAIAKQLNEEVLMPTLYGTEDAWERQIAARYPGRCTACGKGFVAGETIRWLKNKDDTKPRAYCADPNTCAGSLVPASLLPESGQAEIALLLQNGDTNTALQRKKELEEKAAKDAAQSEIDEIEALLKEMS